MTLPSGPPLGPGDHGVAAILSDRVLVRGTWVARGPPGTNGTPESFLRVPTRGVAGIHALVKDLTDQTSCRTATTLRAVFDDVYRDSDLLLEKQHRTGQLGPKGWFVHKLGQQSEQETDE